MISTPAKKYKVLNFTEFSELVHWDVKSLINPSDIFNDVFPVVPFGYFTQKPNIEKINIQDKDEYKILGVRSYGLGTYINRIVLGNSLKMRVYQKAKNNHLFWCKVDTKNGAFGIVTEELEDGIASSNMAFLKINTNKILPSYLQLLFKSHKFNEYMDSFVTGTTNRKYIRPNQIQEEVKIPFPSIEIQRSLVKDYQAKINRSHNLDKQANEFEIQIDNFLLNEINVELPKKKVIKKGVLNFVQFKDIERWDLNNFDIEIINALNEGVYPVKTLGNALDFTSRSWKKKEDELEERDYVELGSIVPEMGITKTKIIKTKNAPSRATQIIKEGDLIIGTTRPYLKRFAIVSDKNNNHIASSGFSVVEENETKYNLNFIKFLLMSEICIEQFKGKMTGALYPAITNSELKEIKIPFPPIEIQNKIWETIEKLNVSRKNNINNVDLLKDQAIKEFEEAVFKN